MIVTALLAAALAGQTAPRSAPNDLVYRHEERPVELVNPNWLRTPTTADIARAYPDRTARMEKTGKVVLRCTVTKEGTVTACQIREESPVGYEFGAAALTLAPLFRMAQTTPGGASVEGMTVSIPVLFRLG